MNTRDLEAFLAVVEAGSIMGAAARLHLTQPGISRRIHVLEETLGVALLDRRSKPLKPTPEGLLAYEHGRRILGVLDDLETGLSAEGDIRGELRLGVTPYLSEPALCPPIDELHRGFPKLTLCVSVGWPEQLLERMRLGELDAAAYLTPAGIDPTHEFVGHALGVQSLAIVAQKNLKLPAHPTLADLAAFSWILNQDGCAIRSVIRREFDRQGVALRIGIEALNAELRMSLVARGLGLTLSTKRAVFDSALRDRLKLVKIAGFEPQVSAWIIHRPTSGRLTRPLNCLTQALVEAVSNPDA